ncbi:MAG: D-alanyl-D-alanine carboxypeptidase [Gammaproteobacteria bacterium]|nr:D-alanyl-D-alanine carboxypeptidase [Gammaproteobacteria bacterium]
MPLSRSSLLLLPCAIALLAVRARADMPLPAPPAINARAWALVDYGGGQVLAGQGIDERHEPASLTKLMTAYVVFAALRDGRLRPGDLVTISERAWRSEGSRSFIKLGSQVPVDVLLKGMIVQSGNDASIALAEHVGGTEQAFVDMMNAYARRLGMDATHFVDASGMPSPQHYSTARDLATLSRALIRDFPEYYGMFALREYTWNNIRQQNRNGLLGRDPSIDGIKTGHTESSGYSLIGSARRQGTRHIAVVLGTSGFKAREDAVLALLNYGFNFYQTLTLRRAGETVLQPRVYKGVGNHVALGTREDVQVAVPRGRTAGVTSRVSVNRPLIAPLAAATPVGELQVYAGTQLLRRVPLYPLQPMGTGGWWSRLYDTVALWFE